MGSGFLEVDHSFSGAAWTAVCVCVEGEHFFSLCETEGGGELPFSCDPASKKRGVFEKKDGGIFPLRVETVLRIRGEKNWNRFFIASIVIFRFRGVSWLAVLCEMWCGDKRV